MRRFPSFTLMSILLACGGGGGTQPSVTRTGDGSSTLRVSARFSASPSGGEEARDEQAMNVDLEVDVRDAAGDDVTGATVVVDTEFGTVTLTEGGCGRRYCGRQVGYASVYRLSVTRGADRLDGVAVSGPSFHSIVEPTLGATASAAAPLVVRWAPAGDADRVRIETREFERELAEDTGAFEIPAGNLRSDADDPEDERVRVRRERLVTLTGGLSGSTMEIAVRNGMSFFGVP